MFPNVLLKNNTNNGCQTVLGVKDYHAMDLEGTISFTTSTNRFTKDLIFGLDSDPKFLVNGQLKFCLTGSSHRQSMR